MKYGPKKKKMNRYERTAVRQQKITNALKGNGLYLFKNHTSGDLMLPKPSYDGERAIKKDGTFRGDSYFQSMVKTHEVTLVTTLENPKSEEKIMETKLIVDQPDRVTTEGKTETVVKKDKKIEEQPVSQEGDILLNDDAIDGVEIILN